MEMEYMYKVNVTKFVTVIVRQAGRHHGTWMLVSPSRNVVLYVSLLYSEFDMLAIDQVVNG